MIDVVDAFRLNFLGDEASGTRLFGTKKDYLGQLKSRFKPLLATLFRGKRKNGERILTLRYSIPEESRRETQGERRQRRGGQEIPKRRAKLLYQGHCTKLQGL